MFQDGGYEYKKAIVEAVLVVVHEIPAAKEPGLAHLCEFIEVCFFRLLSVSDLLELFVSVSD